MTASVILYLNFKILLFIFLILLILILLCYDECIQEGILADFLSRNRAEVISMSILEYDKELEEKKLRKAEYEIGFADGEKAGLTKGYDHSAAHKNRFITTRSIPCSR